MNIESIWKRGPIVFTFIQNISFLSFIFWKFSKNNLHMRTKIFYMCKENNVRMDFCFYTKCIFILMPSDKIQNLHLISMFIYTRIFLLKNILNCNSNCVTNDKLKILDERGVTDLGVWYLKQYLILRLEREKQENH